MTTSTAKALRDPCGAKSAPARIANDAAENGYDQAPGPLTWLNSARVTADPGEDAVHCVVSVGDPRGGFCFTVRRLSDGRIVLHTPHPGQGMPHMRIREIEPGTYEIVDDRGGPLTFRDAWPDGIHDVGPLNVTFYDGRPTVVELMGEDLDDAIALLRDEHGFAVTLEPSDSTDEEPDVFRVVTCDRVTP